MLWKARHACFAMLKAFLLVVAVLRMPWLHFFPGRFKSRCWQTIVNRNGTTVTSNVIADVDLWFSLWRPSWYRSCNPLHTLRVLDSSVCDAVLSLISLALHSRHFAHVGSLSFARCLFSYRSPNPLYTLHVLDRSILEIAVRRSDEFFRIRRSCYNDLARVL